MGSGAAASEMILFIGAVVVSTALVGAFGAVVTGLSGDVRSRGTTLSKELRTDVEIINDPLNMTTSPLTLYVKNTGSVNLFANLTNVLLDGQLSTSLTYDVLASTNDDIWKIGEVLKVVVNDLAVGTGDHRVRVVTETGIDAQFEFNKA